MVKQGQRNISSFFLPTPAKGASGGPVSQSSQQPQRHDVCNGSPAASDGSARPPLSGQKRDAQGMAVSSASRSMGIVTPPVQPPRPAMQSVRKQIAPDSRRRRMLQLLGDGEGKDAAKARCHAEPLRSTRHSRCWPNLPATWHQSRCLCCFASRCGKSIQYHP